MPAIIHIENGEPVGWIIAPNMYQLFHDACARLGETHPAVNALYLIREAVELGIDDVARRELFIGHWLLL